MMNDLKSLVASILRVDPSLLVDDTPRSAIPEWDSFNHLMLISELEGNLGITFTMEEVASIQTFQQLQHIVVGKKS